MRAEPLDPDIQRWLCEVVRAQAGIELPMTDHVLAVRLARVAESEGFPSVEALLRRLRARPSVAIQQRVVEAMANNETTFFRDPWVFNGLRDTLLPELIERHAARRTLTIWCAACSTGQEPYSLAMMLDRSFPQLAGWDVRLIATDLSEQALARARAGRYSQIEINRGLPAHLLVSYFQRTGNEWELAPQIRARVELSQLNLLEPWPVLPPVDILLLRNVLIYFGEDVKRTLLRRVRAALQPDGLLILGSAETPVMIDDAFTPVQVGDAIYYRHG